MARKYCWILVVGFIILTIVITFSKHEEYLVRKIRDFNFIRQRPTNGYIATHINKDCRLKPGTAKFYSQSEEDRALFHNYFNSPPICGGVYVEIGALDGIRYSNTKFFEETLGWRGVLIEAQPDNAKRLKENRSPSRNQIIPEAVCPEGQHHVNFTGSLAVGGIPEKMMEKHKKHFFGTGMPSIVQVPCRPIGRMLRESGIVAIDLFILDVEGAELMVLQTMDWSIPVKVFVVEMGHGNMDEELTNLLESNGYKRSLWNIKGFCRSGHDCANNQVFEHQNYSYAL